MKSAKLISMGVILVAWQLTGCKNNSDVKPNVQDVQLTKLVKTWKALSVSLNNAAQSGYSNFKLVLTGTSGATTFGYTTFGRPDKNPWMTSGSWNFGSDPITMLIRDQGTADELPMTYTISDSQLQITFNYSGSGYPGGRTSNVQGQWIFTLVPN